MRSLPGFNTKVRTQFIGILIVLLFVAAGIGVVRWLENESERHEDAAQRFSEIATQLKAALPEFEAEQLEVDPRVTPELFREWRSPREGRSNPQRMNNPVWEWMITNEANAFIVNAQLKGPSPFDAGPGWCFDRFGRSTTELPDGRIIQIAGEHEDHYDPDFYIYNDVVVRSPDGSIDIFGYPRTTFPPTDFHTATLVDGRILIIGNLGYPEQRRPDTTPVFSLSLDDFSISNVPTSGDAPGWIHDHKAVLSEDGSAIIISGGKLDVKGDLPLMENIDDWKLHLPEMRWERLTRRTWQRWFVAREDNKPNHLHEYQQILLGNQIPELAKIQEDLRLQFDAPTLAEELGMKPKLEVYKKLYRPSIAHEVVPPAEEEYGVQRIKVAGVVVRYVEDSFGIQMTIEGDLPQSTSESLVEDLRGKFSELENARCLLKKL